MVLIWEDGRSRWECISNYAERTIPKEAKFTWDPDPDVKRWYTHDLSKAVKLSAYADPIARQRLEREVKLRKELREASHATDAEVDLPRPEGLDYLPFQRAGILVGTKINNVLIADEQGLGKGQPESACVLTPTGWKQIGTLVPGDLVIGSNGKPTEVTGVFHRGTLPVYRVIFNDGASTVVDGDHLWAVKNHNDHVRGGSWRVIETRQLMAEAAGKWRIPLVSPVEFSATFESALPIDPYLLGVLLGDGGLVHRVMLSSNDIELLDEVEQRLPKGLSLKHSQGYDFRICGDTQGKANAIKNALVSLGLHGLQSHEKFIPAIYRMSSVNTRLELLRGLMDTGGEARYKDGHVEFTSTSKTLAEDVQYLVESLGGLTTGIREKYPHYTHNGEQRDGKTSYRVSIRMPRGMCPFKTKAPDYREKTKYPPNRIIKCIEPAGEERVVCIAVAAEDQLYVTERFVVTHNTIQFLGIVNADPSVKQAVVVCPASLKFNWRDEAQKWFVRPFKTHVVSGSDWPTLDFNESNLIIINYDILDRHYDNLRQRTWDILGCDEVHFIKGGNTLRALNVIGGKKYGKDENGKKKLVKEYTQIPARRRVFMTGTPIPNRPKELWPIVHSLWPDTFRSWWHYANRYCNATNNGWGWNFNGASNLGELQTLLREHGMIRRLKKDVLTELPPKIWRVVEIPANGATRLIEQEREQYEKHRALQEELRVQVELAKASPDPEVFKDAVERLQKGVTASFDAMAKIRHELAIAKIPYIQEHLSVAFDDPDHKVVCFGHHRDFIEALHEKFKKNSVIYYGGMSDKKKDEAKKRFTSDPTCQGFMGSIMAAGVGLTLFSQQSACSHAVFGEMDWVPANMAQAEDRLHRIGQEGGMIELETGEEVRGVLIEIFVFEGTLDCTIAKRVVEKMNVISRALDIDPEQKGLMMEDLQEPVTPEKETAASQGTSRREIHEEARLITFEQLQAIGYALQRLAAFDYDSARERNAVGFNKMDTRIGKELAARSASRMLTPGEAALGKKLVQRYQRQLPVEMIVACGITPMGEKASKRETRLKQAA